MPPYVGSRPRSCRPGTAPSLRRRGNEAPILHPVNAVGAVRWNTAFAYLDPARGRDNLTILADTLVDRVVVAGDRAVGALATRAGELRAQTVVLAAGAYGSPGILLRSGVGPSPPRAARRRGSLRPRRRRLRLRGNSRSSCNARQRSSSSIPRAVHGPGDRRHRQQRVPRLASVTLFLPSRFDPPGRARLRGKRGRLRDEARLPRLGPPQLTRDPRAPLAIDHGFLSRTRATPRSSPRASKLLRRLTGSDAIRTYAGPRDAPRCRGRRAHHHVRDTARGFFHPVATCAIGRVAVDEHCRVLGFENLYVVDASAIPEIPSANTNLTTIALAERAAEWL